MPPSLVMMESRHKNAGPHSCGCYVYETIKLLYYLPLLDAIKEGSPLFIIKLTFLEDYPSMTYGYH